MPTDQPAPVRTFKWGIFDVAYEVPQSHGFPPLVSFWRLRTQAAYGWRFLQDVYTMAPGAFIAYLVCSIWLSISPGLLLYYSHSVLQRIEASTPCGGVNVRTTEPEVSIYLWLFGVFISVVMERLRDEKELLLCAHLRAHFLPLMTKASLEADVKFLHDKRLRRHFPMPCSFGEGGPGWDLLKALVNWTQSVVSFSFEVSVLLLVINQKSAGDRYILGLQAALTFGVLFFAPSNGAHGAGYTFWTTNTRYNRLNSLYSMIFDDKLRETIAKDGLNDFLEKEYRTTSQALGVIKSDALTLACLLPPQWYWALAQTVFLDHPMALCTLFLAWGSPSCIITTIVFFRSATNTLRYTFESFNNSFRSKSWHSLLLQAQALYEPLEQTSEALRRGTVSYPNPSSSKKGMKITLRNVGFQYRNGVKDINALNHISLNIEAGSVVVVVGANGSGKTTLLKLLARLQEPTLGDILIDDIPITEYALTNFRKHVTFLMQSEEIYPLSLRENLLMAISDHSLDEKLVRQKMDEAVNLGGSDPLIKRVGYETVLNPPSILAQSLQGCGNGAVGPGAMRELEKHTGRQRGFPISAGEKQRFVASRAFMRLLNSDTKLLIVDEPTSALDAIAEKNLFRRFQEHREGKTVIFVTHRFGGLVKQADLILCMKEGTIVEQGSHKDLMSLDGEYAKLYNAQL